MQNGGTACVFLRWVATWAPCVCHHHGRGSGIPTLEPWNLHKHVLFAVALGGIYLV